MLIFLLACAPAAIDSAPEPSLLAEFVVEVPSESGAVYEATSTGLAPSLAGALRIAVVDEGHPGRIQSEDCPTDDPIQGCATLLWGLDQPPSLDFGAAELFLVPDGTLALTEPVDEAALALGSRAELFDGAVPDGIVDGTWTLRLPIAHLVANAPDGQRMPAVVRVSVMEE